MRRLRLMFLAALVLGCGEPVVEGHGADGGIAGQDDPADAATGSFDAGSDEADAGDDAGTEMPDASTDDAGWPDAGAFDAGMPDAGTADAGVPDAGTTDAGTTDAGTTDAGTPAPTTALLRPQNPMPCADPAVVSSAGANPVFFIYCTGMAHVWKTADWVHFSDVRSSVTFDLTGMSANGKKMGAWWAPGLVYSPALQQYVMWVSVPDDQATNTTSGWDARSLAVLTAASPAGPWTFQAIAIDAAAGQHFIDPFLFIGPNGGRFVYWKQYGSGVSSSIMGAHVDSTWTQVNVSSQIEIMNGYGGPGTWEDNVRENPAVWYDAADGHFHMLFSGGHWYNDTYATGHAVSSCGALCPSSTSGGWHIADSGDRGIVQVVRSLGNPAFSNGGPGGAVFLDDSGTEIVYAAAARSANGATTRYLMRDQVKWKQDAPYVDTAGHEPLGY